MRAVLVADGTVPERRVLDPALLAPDADGPPLVIAIDGGARKAERLGLVPDILVGDGDSLAPAEVERLRVAGCDIRLFPSDKDESDTELALLEACARGAAEIVVLGAFGGERVEHLLANVALLTLPMLDGRSVLLADGISTVRLLGQRSAPARLELQGAAGDYVSLLPLDDAVEGIVTDGLRYPLRGEPLRLGPARGLSNELVGSSARISVKRGRLIVVHTVRRLLGTLPT